MSISSRRQLTTSADVTVPKAERKDHWSHVAVLIVVHGPSSEQQYREDKRNERPERLYRKASTVWQLHLLEVTEVTEGLW